MVMAVGGPPKTNIQKCTSKPIRFCKALMNKEIVCKIPKRIDLLAFVGFSLIDNFLNVLVFHGQNMVKLGYSAFPFKTNLFTLRIGRFDQCINRFINLLNLHVLFKLMLIDFMDLIGEVFII